MALKGAAGRKRTAFRGCRGGKALRFFGSALGNFLLVAPSIQPELSATSVALGVPGLFDAAPGGETHRAPPIHRRRARAALS